MKRLLRDPLVIFLLIGAGIFLLYSKLQPEEAPDAADPHRIEITSDILKILTAEWATRWNRPPTDQELKGLVDSYIEEEILYREATELGLDQSDSIIRRRLAQKMEFLTSDIADLTEVSDQQLESFYQQQAGNYRSPTEIGFQHLYFSSDQRGDKAVADAAKLLPALNDGSLTFKQAVEQSDRTLLSPEFTATALPIIGRQFGTDFIDAIADAEPGDWFGPVKSGYGLHLVKILERHDAELPELASIRDKVLDDYRFEQREQLNQDMLDELLSKYEVIIAETPEPVEEP